MSLYKESIAYDYVIVFCNSSQYQFRNLT